MMQNLHLYIKTSDKFVDLKGTLQLHINVLILYFQEGPVPCEVCD